MVGRVVDVVVRDNERFYLKLGSDDVEVSHGIWFLIRTRVKKGISTYDDGLAAVRSDFLEALNWEFSGEAYASKDPDSPLNGDTMQAEDLGAHRAE